MAIVKEESKSFPLWFQDGTVNANYSSEYYRCLQNLPIDTVTMTTQTEESFSGAAQYGNGVLAPNGFTYCIPKNSTSILKIDTENHTSTTFNSGLSIGADKHWGGVLGLNGKIYCPPFLGGTILVIDTNTDTAYEIGSFTVGSSTDLWNGGAMGKNGKIYFAPYRNHGVLVLDTTTELTTVIAAPTLNTNANYSSACTGYDGNVYLIPRSFPTIMKVDVTNDTISFLPTSYAATDKWGGGSMDKNGVIFCAPDTATVALKIDTINDTTSTFGTFPTNYINTALDIEGNVWFCPRTQASPIFKRVNVDTDVVTDLDPVVTADAFADIVLDSRGVLNTVPYNSGYSNSIGVPVETNINLPLSRYNSKA